MTRAFSLEKTWAYGEHLLRILRYLFGNLWFYPEKKGCIGPKADPAKWTKWLKELSNWSLGLWLTVSEVSNDIRQRHVKEIERALFPNFSKPGRKHCETHAYRQWFALGIHHHVSNIFGSCIQILQAESNQIHLSHLSHSQSHSPIQWPGNSSRKTPHVWLHQAAKIKCARTCAKSRPSTRPVNVHSNVMVSSPLA